MLERRHTFTKSQDVSIDTDYKPFGDITIRTVPTKSQDVNMEMDYKPFRNITLRTLLTKPQELSMDLDYKPFRDIEMQTVPSGTPYTGARMDIRLQLDCDIDHIAQSLGK